jgi:hypothetical protein
MFTSTRRRIERAAEFLRKYPKFPRGSAGDVLSLAGTDRWAITWGLIKYAVRFSGVTTRRSVLRTAEDLVRATDALRHYFLLSPEEHQILNDHLTAYAIRKAAQVGIGVDDPITSEFFTTIVRETLRAADNATKARVNESYDSLLEEIKRSRITFKCKFPRSQSSAARTELINRGILDSAGRLVMTEINRALDRMESENEQINFVRNLLQHVPGDPSDCHGLVDLRSRFRVMAQAFPHFLDDFNAPDVLNANLTEILENPQNTTQGYLQLLEDADDLGTWRFSLIRASIPLIEWLDCRDANENLQSFFDEFETFLGPAPREFIDWGPERHRRRFKDTLQRMILEHQQPLTFVRELNRASNPEPFRYLFDSDDEMEQFVSKAYGASRFRNGPLGQIFEIRHSNDSASRIALTALQERSYALSFWEMAPHELRCLQAGIIDLIVRSELSESERAGFGHLVLNADILWQQCRTRIWLCQILTQTQRKDLAYLGAYYSVVFGSIGRKGRSTRKRK